MARILVIDDDDDFRSMVVAMLRKNGHTVANAPNGFEAMKLFRADPADLIITDMVMPYDGLATIQILCASAPGVGIIAMSGLAQFRLDYARSLGAHCTLAKPFTYEQLTTAIETVLHRVPAEKPAP